MALRWRQSSILIEDKYSHPQTSNFLLVVATFLTEAFGNCGHQIRSSENINSEKPLTTDTLLLLLSLKFTTLTLCCKIQKRKSYDTLYEPSLEQEGCSFG